MREEVLVRDARRNQEKRVLDLQQYIERLRANAAHCRKLAEAASDPEARQALLEIAGDIDTAIPLLDEHARRDGDV